MGNLPPTFRFPFNTDPDTFPEEEHKSWRRQVHQAIRYAFTGLLDLNQAIPVLKGSTPTPTTTGATVAVAGATTSGSTSTTPPATGKTSQPVAGSSIGTVNDQTGQASYTLQQTDYGALVILNNAGGVALTLNGAVQKPFYARVKVDSGSGIAVFTPSTGTVNRAGFINVAAGTAKSVFYDSVDFNWTTD
jgi:hypothetical protein